LAATYGNQLEAQVSSSITELLYEHPLDLIASMTVRQLTSNGLNIVSKSVTVTISPNALVALAPIDSPYMLFKDGDWDAFRPNFTHPECARSVGESWLLRDREVTEDYTDVLNCVVSDAANSTFNNANLNNLFNCTVPAGTLDVDDKDYTLTYRYTPHVD